MSDWSVYILRCSDGSLYTGIAKNVEKRVNEHNFSVKLAAKYTRGRRPVVLMYQENGLSQSSALRREVQIKGMTRAHKQALIDGKL